MTKASEMPLTGEEVHARDSRHRVWWFVYLGCFFAFEIWALSQVYAQYEWGLANVLTLLMMTSIVGLALKRNLFYLIFWRVLCWIGMANFIAILVVTMWTLRSDGLPWRTVAFVLLYSVPSLPLYIGLCLYAYGSPEIWSPIRPRAGRS